jgi:hypothetical protein
MGRTIPPVRAYFFPGREAGRRALVIGGVHGTEPEGAWTVERLRQKLSTDARRGRLPLFSTILIPVLIEYTHRTGVPPTRSRRYDTGLRYLPGDVEPNRTFPLPGTSYHAARARGRVGLPELIARPFDPAGRTIPRSEPRKPKGRGSTTKIPAETRVLLELLERFRPERIASVHSHQLRRIRPGDGPGVFVDPRGIDPATLLVSDEAARAEDIGFARALLAYARAIAPSDLPDPYSGNRPSPGREEVIYSSSRHPEGNSLGMYAPVTARLDSAVVREAASMITIEVPQLEDAGQRDRVVDVHVKALQDVFLARPLPRSRSDREAAGGRARDRQDSSPTPLLSDVAEAPSAEGQESGVVEEAEVGAVVAGMTECLAPESEVATEVAAGTVIFPSGAALPIVATNVPEGSEHWDPNGSGLPILDTSTPYRSTRLSSNFTVGEIARSGHTFFDRARIDPGLVSALQALRDAVGQPVTITSGYRPYAYNDKLYQGRKQKPTLSQHSSGRAVDVRIAGMSGMDIAKKAIDVCGCNIGVGIAADYAHLDVRGAWARWSYADTRATRVSDVDEITRYRASRCGSPALAPLGARTEQRILPNDPVVVRAGALDGDVDARGGSSANPPTPTTLPAPPTTPRPVPTPPTPPSATRLSALEGR